MCVYTPGEEYYVCIRVVCVYGWWCIRVMYDNACWLVWAAGAAYLPAYVYLSII